MSFDPQNLHRQFEPTRQRGKTWQMPELTDVTAKVVRRRGANARAGTLNGFHTYGIEGMEPNRQACHTEESSQMLLRLRRHHGKRSRRRTEG